MTTQRIPAVFFLLAIAIAVVPSLVTAQTTVSASIYGAFNGSTNGNGTQQSPANQAGGLVELRHTSNPILGFEGTYSFNRADQSYSRMVAVPVCPAPPCAPFIQTLHVPANAHEITANWVPSVHIANVRPFGVLGVGVLLNVPSNSSGSSTNTTPVYVYGAGLDWGLIPHIGLRLQYRGNLYKAPNLSQLYSSTDAFTHNAEPIIGIYFRL
jgi:opacity protein-like surface antigen